MYALIFIIFVQTGLNVDTVNIRIDRKTTNETECKTLAIKETKVLPLSPGNDARWQYAFCEKIQ